MGKNERKKIVNFTEYRKKRNVRHGVKFALKLTALTLLLVAIIIAGFWLRSKKWSKSGADNEKNIASKADADSESWWDSRDVSDGNFSATGADADKMYAEGRRVFLGTYPQGENGEVEKIGWIVCYADEKQVVLVSEYILDASEYYKSSALLNGERNIDDFLNGNFYNQAFSSKEKAEMIKFVLLDGIPVEREENGAYVRIPDSKIIESRLEKMAAAQATPYAQAQGLDVTDDNFSSYWLRIMSTSDIMSDESEAAFMDESGNINKEGFKQDEIKGIRPVICIKTNP